MRSRQEILEERRRLLRGNRFLKDDFHDNVMQMVEKTRAAINDQLAAAARLHTGDVPSRRTEAGAALLDLASLSALVQPEFVAAIHKAIDDAPAPDLDHSWSPLTRAELDRKLRVLEDELGKVEAEDRRRPLLEQRALVDEQLAALGD